MFISSALVTVQLPRASAFQFKMNFTRTIFAGSHLSDLLLGSRGILNTTPTVVERATSGFLSSKKSILLHSHRYLSKDLVRDHGAIYKKRLTKKKKLQCEVVEGFRIIAFSTAEEYNLESLSLALSKNTMFQPTKFGSQFGNTVDVIHAVQNKDTQTESQDIFFFREGSVVLWNVPDPEVKIILNFLKNYEDSSFMDDLVLSESELLNYSYSDIPKTTISKDSLIISSNKDIILEKYAISNAMSLSVHLGAFEANLEQYITTMEPVTEDLKAGVRIKMSRNEVLQKTGQLFALRHYINLSSDLLDTPDFYWDREELEVLYQKMFNYFCISRRTKVINEKINHCIELVELLSSHLNDKHHVRLEWMIIILIMVEVGFETVHYVDRYLEAEAK